MKSTGIDFFILVMAFVCLLMLIPLYQLYVITNIFCIGLFLFFVHTLLQVPAFFHYYQIQLPNFELSNAYKKKVLEPTTVKL